MDRPRGRWKFRSHSSAGARTRRCWFAMTLLTPRPYAWKPPHCARINTFRSSTARAAASLRGFLLREHPVRLMLWLPLLFALSAPAGAQLTRAELISIERPRVLSAADRYLNEPPVTITAVR